MSLKKPQIPGIDVLANQSGIMIAFPGESIGGERISVEREKNGEKEQELKASFQTALHIATKAGLIARPGRPVFRNQEGKQVRVPDWEEIYPNKNEMELIKKLFEPTAVISFPGIALTTRLKMIKALDPPRSIKNQRIFEKLAERVHNFDLNGGVSRADMLKSGRSYFTTDEVNILFVDGQQMPPLSSKFKPIESVWTSHVEDGYTHLDLDSAVDFFLYHSFNPLHSNRFDIGLIDAYLPQEEKMLWATSGQNCYDLNFTTYSPRARNIGIRRAVSLSVRR